MASRSRRSSGAGADKFIWALVVAGLIFAFFQIPYDPGAKGIIEIVQSKAQSVQKWVGTVAPGIQDWVIDIIQGGGEQTPVSTGATWEPYKPLNGISTADAFRAYDNLKIGAAEKVSYNRDEWNHWIDVRTCWTVREQVLARDAQPNTLTLVDKNGAPVTDINQACEITGGTWIDPYSGTTLTNPKDLDIDHMVPLKYAATHGGQQWDSKKKEEYANSLDTGHLLAVSASENRSKSDKGPSEYIPKNEAYQCAYGTSWAQITTKWGLSVTEADANSIKNLLSKCH